MVKDCIKLSWGDKNLIGSQIYKYIKDPNLDKSQLVNKVLDYMSGTLNIMQDNLDIPMLSRMVSDIVYTLYKKTNNDNIKSFISSQLDYEDLIKLSITTDQSKLSVISTDEQQQNYDEIQPKQIDNANESDIQILYNYIDSEKLNPSVKSDNSLSVEQNLFAGAIRAYNYSVRRFKSDLSKVILVDFEKGTLINNNQQLNDNIRNYKNQLLSTVMNRGRIYLSNNNKQLPENTTDSELPQVLINSAIESFDSMTNRKLQYLHDKAAINNYSGKEFEELNEYFSLIVLNNFDSFLDIYLPKIVNIKSYLKNNNLSDSQDKYSIVDIHKIQFKYGQDDPNIFGEISQVVNLLFDSTPLIDESGKIIRNRFMNTQLVIPTIVKLKKNINDKSIRLNTNEGIKKALELGLSGNYKLNKNELTTIRSIYSRFYKDNSNTRTSKEVAIINKNIKDKSLYEIFKSYPDSNLLSNISQSMLKSYGRNYTQIVWDYNENSWVIQNLKSNLSNKQKVLFVNNVNNFANNINFSQKNKIFNKFNISVDVSSRSVKFLGSFEYSLRSNKSPNLDIFKELSEGDWINVKNNKYPLDSRKVNYLSLINSIESLLQYPLDPLFINTFKEISGDNYLWDLINIAANSAYIMEISSSENITNNHMKAKNISAFTNQELKDRSVRNDPNKISVFTDNNLRIANNLGEARSILNGDVVKPILKDANGNTVPVIGLMSLFTDKDTHFEIIKSTEDWDKSFTNSTLFAQNYKLLKDVYLRTDVSKDESITQAHKFQVGDTAITGIMMDFFKNLINNYVSIQPIVYADKKPQSIQEIDMGTPVRYYYNNSLIINKPFKNFTISDYHDINFYSMQTAYNNLYNQIMSDYNSVFNFIGKDEIMNKFKSSYPELFNNINDNTKAIPEEFKGKKYNNIFNTYNKIKSNKKLNTDDINELLKIYKSTDLSKYASQINIKLVSEIHSSRGQMNKLLLSYHNLYNSREEYDKKVNKSNKKFMRDLYENNFIIDMSDRGGFKDTLSTVWKKLKLEGNIDEWIDEAEYLIPYKYSDEITDKIINDDNINIELNPLLSYFQASNVLFTNSINSILVGGEIAHGKPQKDSEIEESARWIAQTKRMVIYQATMHPFQQGLLNGIPGKVKVAVIEDLPGFTFNTDAEVKKMDAQDGSAWSSGIAMVLKNNSLGDVATKGWNHKTIGHELLPKYNASVLFKYAEFGVNNSMMRMSNGSIADQEIMFKHMHDLQWDQEINIFDSKWGLYNIPLTIDNILQNNPYNDSIISYKLPSEDFIRNVDSISYVGKTQEYINNNPDETFINLYEIRESKKDSSGMIQHLEPTIVNIKNLYDLWKVFGGKYSISKVTSGNIKIANDNYSYSESSIFNAAHVVNSIVELKSGANPNILSQTSYNQPLKNKLIYKFSNISGTKNGSQNINSNKAYTDPDYKISTFDFDTRFWGLQMSADHDADESDVTVPTQVISAAIANGYTYDIADQMYTDISNFVHQSMSEYDNTLEEVYKGDKQELYTLISKKLYDSVSTRPNVSLAYKLLSEIGKELEDKIIDKEKFNNLIKTPFSDNNIFGLMVSTIQSSLNSEVIKIKGSGSGSVIFPSHSVVSVIDTPDGNTVNPTTYSQITNGENSIIFEKTVNNITASIDNIIDSDYFAYNNKVYRFNTPKEYWDFKDNRILPDEQVIESDDLLTYVFGNPRDLNPEIVTWEFNNRKYSRMDLDSVRIRYIFEDILKLSNNIKDQTNNLTKINKDRNLSEYEKLQISQILESEVNKLNTLSNSKYGQMLKNFLNIDTFDNLNSSEIKQIRIKLRGEIQKDNELLSKGLFRIPGTDITTEINNLIIKPAEIIAPKIYKTKFQLEDGIDLSQVNENYFLDKLNKVSTPEISWTDMFFKSLDGKHTYVIEKSNYEMLLKNELNPENISNINKEIYDNRLIINNHKTYDVTGIEFKEYKDSGRSYEIIVYDESKVDPINLSKYYGNIQLQWKGINLLSNLKILSNYSKIGIKYREYANNLINNITNYKGRDLNEYLYKTSSKLRESDSEFNNSINTNQAKELYSSFKVSTDIIGARIPAQTLQSFMGAKVIGFSEGDMNSAFVPIKKNWLDGSDKLMFLP